MGLGHTPPLGYLPGSSRPDMMTQGFGGFVPFEGPMFSSSHLGIIEINQLFGVAGPDLVP